MLITPSFKISFIEEKFQENYLKTSIVELRNWKWGGQAYQQITGYWMQWKCYQNKFIVSQRTPAVYAT